MFECFVVIQQKGYGLPLKFGSDVRVDDTP